MAAEREIPSPIRERLSVSERALYQRVQLVIDKGDDQHVEVVASVLDELFDRFALTVRREMVAEEEARQLREDVATMQQQADAAADIIVGLAKLLSEARKGNACG